MGGKACKYCASDDAEPPTTPDTFSPLRERENVGNEQETNLESKRETLFMFFALQRPGSPLHMALEALGGENLRITRVIRSYLVPSSIVLMETYFNRRGACGFGPGVRLNSSGRVIVMQRLRPPASVHSRASFKLTDWPFEEGGNIPISRYLGNFLSGKFELETDEDAAKQVSVLTVGVLAHATFTHVCEFDGTLGHRLKTPKRIHFFVVLAGIVGKNLEHANQQITTEGALTHIADKLVLNVASNLHRFVNIFVMQNLEDDDDDDSSSESDDSVCPVPQLISPHRHISQTCLGNRLRPDSLSVLNHAH